MFLGGRISERIVISLVPWVGAVRVLDHPEGVHDLAVLVVGYLLEVEVGAVVGLQSGVPIVLKRISH